MEHATVVRRWLAVVLLAVAPAAAALPCAPGTLADYVALGAAGCEIGDVVFSNFLLPGDLPAGSIPIEAEAVGVVPQDPGDGPLLTFALNADASAGTFLDLRVFFRVAASGGLAFASAVLNAATATGDGVVTLIEDICAGGAFLAPPLGCGAQPVTLIPFVVEGFGAPAAGAAFATAGTLEVVADFGIDGGLAGAASLGSATLRFAASAPVTVREPPSALLAALALALVAVRRFGRRA